MRERASRPIDLTHVPRPGWCDGANTILRAGRVAATPGAGVRRQSYPGQDVLYCVSGRGEIESEGRHVPVGEANLAWIANERPHAHRADVDRPWTLLWCRIDGPTLPALRPTLFSGPATVVRLPDQAAVQSWFERVFSTLRQRDFAASRDAGLNLLVAELVAAVSGAVPGGASGRLPVALTDLVDAIGAAPGRSWTARDMSEVTGLSAAQTRRLFARHLGLAPRAWLRRQRILLAQRLIVELDMPFARIAERCGFFDVHHFARAFRDEVGIPPGRWRGGGTAR